jgi:hypothetical protein
MQFSSANPLTLLQRVWAQGNRVQRVIATVAVSAFLIGAPLVYLLDTYLSHKIGQLLLGAAGLIYFYLDASLRAGVAQRIEERIERAERAIEEHPERARPLWDLARSRLELYFERNLSQIKAIFWVTLLVMLAGFAMVGYGITRAFDGADIKPALLTTACGLLTEFIAASFLFIYRSTMQQAADYVETLERINAVGMSIQIAETISDASITQRDEIKGKLVLQILTTFGERRPTKG